MNPTDSGGQNTPGRHAPPQPPTPAALPETCDRMRPDLKAFEDGQLGWWRRQMVSRHVAHCDACREEMQAMREFSAKWRKVDGETLDPGLRARILAAVPDTVPDAPQAASRNVPRRQPLIFVGAAASTALIAGVAVSMFSSRAPRLADSSSQSVSSAAKNSAAVAAPEMAASQASAVPEQREAALAGVSAPASPVLSARQKASQIASVKPLAGEAAGGAAIPRQFAPVQEKAGRQAAAAGKAAPTLTSPGSSVAEDYDASGAVKQDRSPGKSAEGEGNGAGRQALKRSASAVAPAPPASEAPGDSSAVIGAQDTAAASAPGGTPPPAPAKSVRAAAVPPAAHAAGAAPKTKAAPRRERALASPAFMSDAAAAPAVDVTLFLEADKIEQAGAAIEREAARVGGSVGNSDLTTHSENAKSATLKLKIPAAQLRAFLDYAAQFGDRPADQASKAAKDGEGNTAREEKPAVAQNVPRKLTAPTDVIIRLKTKSP